MSQGASTPIEVRVAGKDMLQIAKYADTIVQKMKTVTYLRDVQISQPLKMPTIEINIDRDKAAQWGVTVDEIARSVTASTSSSRFTQKIQWLDEKAAYTYQVQVQVPEYVMQTVDELKEISLTRGKARPVLADVATFNTKEVPGEYDRMGPRRFLTINANIHKKDLGTATTAVQQILHNMGEPPKGIKTEVLGVSRLFSETMDSLQTGLSFAVLIIFLLLAANYQSVKLSAAVLVTVPAVILGSLLLLLQTGSTLNLQSYMGIIMSIGVSVANAILIVTNAEQLRLEYRDAEKAAVMAASIRLRPILMTSLAMIAGMIPMASGMGEAGEQSAPLGRAVIGGLIASTFAALFILPLAFAAMQKKSTLESPSLLPDLKRKKLGEMLKLSSLLIGIVLLANACGNTHKPVDMTAGKPQPVQTVECTQVVRRPLSSVAKLPGELKPFEAVAIYPKVTGFLKQVPVDMGTVVRKGQVLMVLEAPEIAQHLQAAKARYAQVQAISLHSKDRYERIRKTAETPGAVSPYELESAKATMKADEATLEAEKANVAAIETSMAYLTVTAPFDGIITERNVHPGALVGPDTKGGDKPPLVLQQEKKLRLVVYAPEYLNVDDKGMVSYQLSSNPGKTYQARIARYAGAMSAGMRSEAYEMDIQAEDRLVKPGMFAEVLLPLKVNAQSFVVPGSTIVNTTTGKYLIALDEGRHTRFIHVKEGISSNDSTEVFGQLAGNEQVLLHPSADITEGAILK